MATIGEALSELEAQLFVGRARELAVFADWLAGDAPAKILNVSGPGGAGKSALLGAFGRLARDRGRPAVLVDGRTIRTTPEGLLDALGGGTVEAVVAALNMSRPLVLIDTFEELIGLAHFLREELLARVDTGVRLVIAGREPLGPAWGGDGAWAKLIRPLPLEGLSPIESREYLAGHGVTGADLQEQILGVAGGHPLALSLAADLAVQFGVRDFVRAPEWRLAVRTLTERLLRDVGDPALRELLESGAVVRQFDEATLEAVSGRSEIGAAFDRLCRLSIVRAGERGLMVHDDVRRILADDLRWRRRERYDGLRRRALGHYRERMRAASAGEREWLIREGFFLWEDAFGQAMLFGQEERGTVYVEPGRPSDLPDLERIWVAWLEQLQDHDALDAEGPLFRALLRHPATRLRVARDRHGGAVGFSTVLPVYRGSLEHLAAWPGRTRLLEAYLTSRALERLPAAADDADVYCLLQVATAGRDAMAALLRDWFGLAARGGTYLVVTFVDEYKRLLEAGGFEQVPEARRWVRGPQHPLDGYVLDLRRIEVEPWIEAILDGRRPPRALSAEELERELQAALLHWHEDGWLARSPLGGAEPTSGPALRRAIQHALARARERATPDRALACRALELAYLDPTMSHDRAAEELAVSRTTFYRLLKRGINGLADAWARHGETTCPA